ncbi:MAG: tetratricopeptide repeat protein, partial [Acidobacteriota bacterium]|nr:tetratricopeptide repeat protein [Acidobacteriota bacterium]
MLTRRLSLQLLILTLSTVFAQAQVTPEPVTLVPGKPMEREIAGGGSHTYQITLQAGQFMRLVVEQKEINVTLVLATPDGKQLVEMNLTRAGGLESLSEEAAASGDYRLTIRADGAATLAGSYQVRLETRAAATAQDRQRIAAERLLREAKELRTQGRKTAEPAIDKLQQALAVWRELNESTWVAWSLSNIGGANSSLGRYEKALEY